MPDFVTHFALVLGDEFTTFVDRTAASTALEDALQALDAITDVQVVRTNAGGKTTYMITFLNPGNKNVAQLSGVSQLLSYNKATGVLDFSVDFGAGVQLTRPFSLDLTQAGLPDALKAVLSLVGFSAEGNLAVSANATLKLRLGLDLAAPIVIKTTTQGGKGLPLSNEVQTLKVHATGGSYKLTLDVNNNGKVDIGETTDEIAFNATAGVLDAELEALFGEALFPGPDDVSVTLVAGLYTITFKNTAGAKNIAPLKPITSGTNPDFGLTGDERSFFLYTGAQGTTFTAAANATASNVDLAVKLGPFGLFVQDGSASIGAKLDLHLLDGDGDGRLVLIGFGGSGITSDLGHLGAFVKKESIKFEGTAKGVGCPDGSLACTVLPIYVGTSRNQVPIDFLDGTPGKDGDGTGPDGDHVLRASVGIVLEEFFDGFDDVEKEFLFAFKLPHWDTFDFKAPTIFALLSDPSMVVDGLDQILLTLQETLSGQIFGVELPFIGEALRDNPAAKVIEDFRGNFLTKLSDTIRENNLDLDGLADIINSKVSEIFGSSGLNILKGAPTFRWLNKERTGTTSPLLAEAVQFDFVIGKTLSFELDEINFDLGLDVLGISASFTPRVTIDFQLHFGFGVHADKGFYFVADDLTTPNRGPELKLNLAITFSGIGCRGPPNAATVDRATVGGRLLFLALNVTDGIDMDGDGQIDASCTAPAQGQEAGYPDTHVSPQTEELTKLYFSGSIDIADVAETGKPQGDGMLTVPELFSASLLDIFKIEPVRRRSAARRGGGRLQHPRPEARQHPAVRRREAAGRLRAALGARQAAGDQGPAGRHRGRHARPRLVHLRVRRADPQLRSASSSSRSTG